MQRFSGFARILSECLCGSNLAVPWCDVLARFSLSVHCLRTLSMRLYTADSRRP
jgi:hypothetical protein